MSKEEETQEFMIRFLEARVNIEVDRNKYLADELAKEKAIVKGLQDHANEIDDFEIKILEAKDNRTIN